MTRPGSSWNVRGAGTVQRPDREGAGVAGAHGPGSVIPLVSLYDTDELVIRAQLPNRHLPAIRAAMAAGQPLAVRGMIDGVALRAELRSLAGEAASGTGGVDWLVQGQRRRRADQPGPFRPPGACAAGA